MKVPSYYGVDAINTKKYEHFFKVDTEISTGSDGYFHHKGKDGTALSKNKCLEYCTPNCDYIKRIMISDQNIGIQNLKIFLTSYTQDTLVDLRIHRTTMKDHDARLIIKGNSLVNLERLDLSDHQFSLDLIFRIADTPALSNLQSLVLNRAFKDKDLSKMHYYHNNLKNLRSLSLEGNDLSGCLINLMAFGFFAHSFRE